MAERWNDETRLFGAGAVGEGEGADEAVRSVVVMGGGRGGKMAEEEI